MNGRMTILNFQELIDPGTYRSMGLVYLLANLLHKSTIHVGVS